jgi:peptidoglycan-associated lipoprotein
MDRSSVRSSTRRVRQHAGRAGCRRGRGPQARSKAADDRCADAADQAAAGLGVDLTTKPGGRSILTDPSSPLSKRSIYFDYDRYDVKEEFRPLVELHARYLRDNQTMKMLIQGNTDERGSREYNLALGQRRSEAIKRMMLLLGAREEQVEAVSLGEEKPKATGSTKKPGRRTVAATSCIRASFDARRAARRGACRGAVAARHRRPRSSTTTKRAGASKCSPAGRSERARARGAARPDRGPAPARRASPADRGGARELAKMRGQLEVLANQIDTADKRQKDLYVDIDTRLRKLEQPKEPAARRSRRGKRGAGRRDQGLRGALNQFKLGNYPLAISAFQGFLVTYPTSKLAASAQYWIGNAHFAQRDYKQAIAAQQKLLAAGRMTPRRPTRC